VTPKEASEAEIREDRERRIGGEAQEVIADELRRYVAEHREGLGTYPTLTAATIVVLADRITRRLFG
jgi:hypothetical protein